jgi:hypothetical protein
LILNHSIRGGESGARHRHQSLMSIDGAARLVWPRGLVASMPQWCTTMTAHPNAFLIMDGGSRSALPPIAVPEAVMGRFRMDANVR